MKRLFVVAVLAGLLGVTVVLGAAVNLVPRLLGWQALTIVSGSMAPSVRPGDVVVVDPGPGWPAPVGTVITYRRPGTGALVTHRVISVDLGQRAYLTRGDANPVADAEPVPAADVLGTVRMVVPSVGLPTLFPAARIAIPVLLLGMGYAAHRLLRDRPGRRPPPVVGAAGLCLVAVAVCLPIPSSSTAQFTATTASAFTIDTRNWSVFTQKTQASGPVSYWQLDETSGSTAADLVGSAPMSYVGSPSRGLAGAVTGGGKYAIGLTGSAQGTATLAAAPASLDLRGPISVMAWVKLPAGGGNTTNGRVVSKYTFSNPGGVSYLMALDSTATSMRFLFDLTAGTPSRPVASTPAPADGAWHFYVGTWDGSTVRIYKDGVAGGSATVTGAGQLVSTSSRVTVGAPGFNESALGQMDEVAIWDRALTPAEITTLYAAASQ